MEKYSIRAVYLFGSYARNESTDTSDIDLLMDKTGSKIRGMFDMGGLYSEPQKELGKDVDIMTTHMLEQKSALERTSWFAENVKTEMGEIANVRQQRF